MDKDLIAFKLDISGQSMGRPLVKLCICIVHESDGFFGMVTKSSFA